MDVKQLQLGTLTIDLNACVIRWPARNEELTPQEVLILKTLWAAPQHTCSQEDLYRAVWGYRSKPQGRALYYAMRRIRYKIEAEPSKPVYLKTVRNLGFRLDGVTAAEENPVETHPPATRLVPLPTYHTSFVGREAECAQMTEHHASEAVVTIVGPGGLGKTRFAIYWAHSLTAHRIAFCELLDVNNEEQFAHAISKALGFEASPHNDPAQLHLWIEQRCDLLILDNAEGVRQILPKILNQWVAQHPHIRVLITSRSPIKCHAEYVLPLPPLSHKNAMQLVSDRIARAGGKARAAEFLVRQLEGHPLLLELTAPKTAKLGPAIVTKHLIHQQNVLHSIDTSRPPRHQQLSNLLDSTYQELSAEHLLALQQLAIIQASFNLELCEVLLGDEAYLSIETLLGANLLRSEISASPIRWRIPIYVRSTMPAIPDIDRQQTLDRLCDYYESKAPALNTFSTLSPNQYQPLATELSALTAAWTWAETNRTPMSYAKISYLLAQSAHWAGFIVQVTEHLERTLQLLPEEHPYRPYLTLQWVSAAAQRATPEHVLKRLLPLLKQTLTPHERASCLHACVKLHAPCGDIAIALQRTDEGLRITKENGFETLERSFATLAVGYSTVSEPMVKARARAEFAKKLYRGIDALPEQLNLATQLNILDVYAGDLHTVLPRLAPFMEIDSVRPWVKVWRRFFWASIQFEVGDQELQPQTLRRIATDAEAQGMLGYQASTLRVLSKLLLTLNAPQQAYDTAKQTLETFQGSGFPKAQAEALVLAAQAALALGQFQDAWKHLVQLEPHAHYLWWPQAQLALRLLHARVQHQMGLDITKELPELDEAILNFEAPLYRGRYCHVRSVLAQEMKDSQGHVWWATHAQEALRHLRGGCPLDLLPLK